MLGTDAVICGESETGWQTFFAATRASDDKAIRLHKHSPSALTSPNSKAISEQQCEMKCRAKATHAVERIYKSSQKIYRQTAFCAQHPPQQIAVLSTSVYASSPNVGSEAVSEIKAEQN